MCSFAETTHTPQGDGNPLALRFACSSVETTHTPQGDGNLSRGHSAPAQGRNNPHPARGRKPSSIRFGRQPARETTHTPQGDGNAAFKLSVSNSTETTHTPQGDGNSWFCSPFRIVLKQPTPRKGTETLVRVRYVKQRRNNPHPARGRKLVDQVAVRTFGRNNPHPARGRKLIHRTGRSTPTGKNPHPPRGRKPKVIIASPQNAETTHTPQGDGNRRWALTPAQRGKQPTPRKGTETQNSSFYFPPV